MEAGICFERERQYTRFDFRPAVFKIIENIGLGVGRDDFRAEMLRVRNVLDPRKKFCLRGVPIKMRVEDAMVGNVPKLVAETRRYPEILRTEIDCLAEHSERGAILAEY